MINPFFDPELKRDQLAHQQFIIREFMFDGQWHTLDEISTETGYTRAEISKQLANLEKVTYGAHTVKKRRRNRERSGLLEYHVIERIEPYYQRYTDV